jgi:hypothetical protein
MIISNKVFFGNTDDGSRQFILRITYFCSILNIKFMENQEEKKPFNIKDIDVEKLHKTVSLHKHILNKFEQINYTVAGKRGLTAEQVATTICRENPQLLEMVEIKEIIVAWNTDRKDLKEYRRRERMAKKGNN